jgi:HEAT repeat protein
VSAPVSAEVNQLVRSLFEQRSLLDRVRRQDPRIASLAQIAASGEIRVVPDLLGLLAADDALTPHVSRAIGTLMRQIAPAQLAWLDQQVRSGSPAFWSHSAWHRLAPNAVSRLAQASNWDTPVIGLVASHANGFVRAAALELLAARADGRELPFLALRANDWVEPVAARARQLLLSSLRPDNRRAILDALPFVVRLLAQRRRDHVEIERSLRAVLVSEGGQDALARRTEFDTSVRRIMYELLTSGESKFRRRVIDAASMDADAVIRTRAITCVASDVDVEDGAAILERFLHDDPVPAVRRLSLAALSERLPDRIAGLFPAVLFDPAASVRSLARFVASTHRLALVPKEIYVHGLVSRFPRQLATAIEGVGETGSRCDADLLVPFLSVDTPRIRRVALQALSRLNAEGAISAAITALADDASSVRSAAADVLSTHASSVDFGIVGRRIRSLSDAQARQNLLRVFMDAPKWDAPVFLLEVLEDPDEGVRTSACRLIERWVEGFNRNQTQPTSTQLHRIGALLDSVASRMPEQTAKTLRFSIKSR